MKEDEKAARTVAAVTDGNGQMSIDGIRIPGDDYITAFEPAQGTIASILLTGRINAITANELCRITRLPSRVVTKKIQAERLQGAPILSSPDCGYWLASDAAEVLSCVDALHKRARSIRETAAALRRIVVKEA